MTNQYGADVLRLYVASMDYADDISVSERGIKEMSEAYRKIRNTFRYLLGNLDDYQQFNPQIVDLQWLHPIDRWASGSSTRSFATCGELTNGLSFIVCISGSISSAAVELSSFYLDVLKDRLYAESPAGPDRRAAQFVLARLHDHLARLLAPIIPHTAEESWDYVPASSGKARQRASVRIPCAEPAWDGDARCPLG